MSQAKTWWYAVGGQQFGPCTPSELRALAQQGHFGPNDLVWKTGAPEWVAASTINGLIPAASSRPPVAPPSVAPAAAPQPSPNPQTVAAAPDDTYGATKLLCLIGLVAVPSIDVLVRWSMKDTGVADWLDLVTAVFMLVLIFIWYRADADSRQMPRSGGMSAFIILLPILAIPYHLFKTRGGARGFLALLGVVGLLFVAAIISGAIAFALDPDADFGLAESQPSAVSSPDRGGYVITIPPDPDSSLSQYSQHIRQSSEVRLRGVLKFGHDAAGGYVGLDDGDRWIKVREIWLFEDDDMLIVRELMDSGAPVVVSGVMLEWKDGGYTFSDAALLEIASAGR